MKVALIVAGQPRFTPSFPIFLNQLKGVDQIDVYMFLWDSWWATTSEQALSKIQPLCPPLYNIKRIVVEKEPPYQLPPHQFNHNTEEKESVRWWYKRRRAMWMSTYRAFELIEEPYDMIIKGRGDVRLDRDLDLNTVDMSRGAVGPANNRHGTKGREICDQLCIGTPEDMRFFANMTFHVDNYIPIVCDYWEQDVHDWASEHLLGYYYFKHNKQQVPGNFNIALKAEGRSLFDDKDLHLPTTTFEMIQGR
jgi:hypothetical protein